MTSQKSVCIDTNIIVHHVMGDDQTFVQLLPEVTAIFIPLPIVFETVFVLEKIYCIERQEIVFELQKIFSEDIIKTSKTLLSEIFSLYLQQRSLSIIDCYVACYAKLNELQLVTADKKLKKVAESYV